MFSVLIIMALIIRDRQKNLKDLMHMSHDIKKPKYEMLGVVFPDKKSLLSSPNPSYYCRQTTVPFYVQLIPICFYFHPGQFTLFAPTDLAFNQFLQKLGGVKEVTNKSW